MKENLHHLTQEAVKPHANENLWHQLKDLIDEIQQYEDDEIVEKEQLEEAQQVLEQLAEKIQIVNQIATNALFIYSKEV